MRCNGDCRKKAYLCRNLLYVEAAAEESLARVVSSCAYSLLSEGDIANIFSEDTLVDWKVRLVKEKHARKNVLNM